jgi:hypothetical protein
MNTSELVTQTIASWCAENNIASTSKSVRSNTNGYCYVTFINKENKAENVYFSQKSEVGAGDLVTKELFAQYEIGHCTNADNEIRIKLIRKGGDRVDVADLF